MGELICTAGGPQPDEEDEKQVASDSYLDLVSQGQYWRLERLKCFDEFLERRFPESRSRIFIAGIPAEPLGRAGVPLTRCIVY
jgi:hypothetical protein